MRSTRWLFSCIIFPLTFFGQNKFSEINHPGLKLVLESAYNETVQQIARSMPEFPRDTLPKYLKFEFDNSNVRANVNDDYKMVYFTQLNAWNFTPDSMNLLEVWYTYTYRWNKVRQDFSMVYDLNGHVKFAASGGLSKLIVLDNLQKGLCNSCLQTIDNYAKQNSITRYHLMVEVVNVDSKLPDSFLWVVVPDTGPHKGEATFINPRTGKKADVSQMFSPPKLKSK